MVQGTLMSVDARLLVRAGICALERWKFDAGPVTVFVMAHAGDTVSLTHSIDAPDGGQETVEVVRMEVLTCAEGQIRVGYGPESRTLVVEMPAPGMALLPRRVD